MYIGPYQLDSNLLLAPMAGVTDLPFRQLCRRFGAGLAVTEMISSSPGLRDTVKTLRRTDFRGEVGPVAAQIVGAEPRAMAEAACFNARRGAQIIDINMGCPARKVCKKAAGSALLKDEGLVGAIVNAVTSAVDVPVTLKIRTGWDRDHRNGARIAKIAEQAGIAAIAVHGRTRACGFHGEVDYRTIRTIKESVAIPVIANGDIDSPEKAKAVLNDTKADGLMIGRAAWGRPWIFREILHYLEHGQHITAPRADWITDLVVAHLRHLHRFYGETPGVRIARKHIAWYSRNQLCSTTLFQKKINTIDSAEEQLACVREYFLRRNPKQEIAA
ncbi:MAG: tRNA dihydrouridine synthase DusB [Gammaproteobacteria bacterium]|nr:tRNA dihydrouridine synthase DusB [Gammaproteobacteria bacterium]